VVARSLPTVGTRISQSLRSFEMTEEGGTKGKVKETWIPDQGPGGRGGKDFSLTVEMTEEVRDDRMGGWRKIPPAPFAKGVREGGFLTALDMV